MGALPAPVTSIGTASASAAAAKTSAATKTAAWVAVLNAFGGLLIGFLAAYLGYKTDLADAASARQRQVVRQFYGVLAATVLVSVGLLLVVVLVRSLALSHPGLYASLAIASALSWVPPIGLLLVRIARAVHAQSSANVSSATGGCGGPAAYEYCSSGIMIATIPIHGARTLYGQVGDLFAYLCVAGLIFLAGRALWQRKKLAVTHDLGPSKATARA